MQIVNNFYASCERLFRPELRGRPIVVLSNNDGCVVSRSLEAKALGIKMAVPYFKIREQFEAHGGVAFSSNYALYGDMSGRVMSTLETMAPELEVYSIDEAFLSLSESFAGDLTAFMAPETLSDNRQSFSGKVMRFCSGFAAMCCDRPI